MRYAFWFLPAIILTASLVLAGEGAAAQPANTADGAPAAPQNKRKPAAQILLKIQVLEVSKAEMNRLGFAFQAFDKIATNELTAQQANPSKNEPLRIGVSDDGSRGFIKALCKEGAAKVVAEPTLATVAGRPASYFAGREVHAKRKGNVGTPPFRRVGTEVEFVPILLDENRLRLELRARVSQLDPSMDMIRDGDRVLGIRMAEVDAGVELEFSKTAVIAGPVQRREIPADKKPGDSKDREYDLVETVFLVTPERVAAFAPAALPQSSARR